MLNLRETLMLSLTLDIHSPRRATLPQNLISATGEVKLDLFLFVVTNEEGVTEGCYFIEE